MPKTSFSALLWKKSFFLLHNIKEATKVEKQKEALLLLFVVNIFVTMSLILRHRDVFFHLHVTHPASGMWDVLIALSVKKKQTALLYCLVPWLTDLNQQPLLWKASLFEVEHQLLNEPKCGAVPGNFLEKYHLFL